MFAAYPGFENLPLRVEVEWRGHKRPLVARLSSGRYRISNHAVLVCAFEDDADDGEWLVMNGAPTNGNGLDTANKLVHRAVVFDVTTRLPAEVYRWKDKGRARIEERVWRSFLSKAKAKANGTKRSNQALFIPVPPYDSTFGREFLPHEPRSP